VLHTKTAEVYNDPRFNAPDVPEAELRAQRLAELSIGHHPDAEFDDLAAKIARLSGVPYAMVNFLGDQKQYFSGLHAGATVLSAAAAAAQPPPFTAPGREMSLDHGFCPHVVVRRKALLLDDVCDYPRFSGNPVVDQLGIRSYAGAPVIDATTGVVLGTVCAIATTPQHWGQPGLDMIKTFAAEAATLIERREHQHPLPRR